VTYCFVHFCYYSSIVVWVWLCRHIQRSTHKTTPGGGYVGPRYRYWRRRDYQEAKKENLRVEWWGWQQSVQETKQRSARDCRTGWNIICIVYCCQFNLKLFWVNRFLTVFIIIIIIIFFFTLGIYLLLLLLNKCYYSVVEKSGLNCLLLGAYFRPHQYLVVVYSTFLCFLK